MRSRAVASTGYINSYCRECDLEYQRSYRRHQRIEEDASSDTTRKWRRCQSVHGGCYPDPQNVTIPRLLGGMTSGMKDHVRLPICRRCGVPVVPVASRTA